LFVLPRNEYGEACFFFFAIGYSAASPYGSGECVLMFFFFHPPQTRFFKPFCDKVCFSRLFPARKRPPGGVSLDSGHPDDPCFLYSPFEVRSDSPWARLLFFLRPSARLGFFCFSGGSFWFRLSADLFLHPSPPAYTALPQNMARHPSLLSESDAFFFFCFCYETACFALIFPASVI